MGANPLNNISIILVEPRGPLNVGATARAMKNMGLSRLTVVGSMDLASDECRLMASGSVDILEQAEIAADFEEAVANKALIIGTTARGRHRIETRTPAEAAPEILRVAASQPVAIVFGREDFGLFKEELAQCHVVMSIATSADRASLNLAQAVLLVCYELFQQSGVDATTASTDLGNLIEGAQWQRLYQEVLLCCAETGYMSEGNRLAIEESFRRLLKLGPIQTRDARHLFGLVRRVARMIDGRVEARPGQTFYPRQAPPRKEDS